jgi:cell division protein FtsB
MAEPPAGGFGNGHGDGGAMELVFEVKRRARHVIWPTLAVLVLAYMAYHIVHGDRGLVAWREFRDRIAIMRVELAAVATERQAMAVRAGLLHPDSIDPDMLDEWARRLLNYGRPDDLVIMLKAENGHSPPAPPRVATPQAPPPTPGRP